MKDGKSNGGSRSEKPYRKTSSSNIHPQNTSTSPPKDDKLVEKALDKYYGGQERRSHLKKIMMSLVEAGRRATEEEMNKDAICLYCKYIPQTKADTHKELFKQLGKISKVIGFAHHDKQRVMKEKDYKALKKKVRKRY